MIRKGSKNETVTDRRSITLNTRIFTVQQTGSGFPGLMPSHGDTAANAAERSVKTFTTRFPSRLTKGGRRDWILTISNFCVSVVITRHIRDSLQEKENDVM